MIPLYGTLAYTIFVVENVPISSILVQLVFGITLVLPLIFYGLLKRSGHITSSNLSNTKERWLPLCINTILLSIVVVFTNQFNHIILRDWIILLAIQNVMTLILLSIPFKTSIHMFNNMSLVLFLTALPIGLSPYPIIVIATVWIILIGTARLILKAHRFIELIIGLSIAVIVHLGYHWCH